MRKFHLRVPVQGFDARITKALFSAYHAHKHSIQGDEKLDVPLLLRIEGVTEIFAIADHRVSNAGFSVGKMVTPEHARGEETSQDVILCCVTLAPDDLGASFTRSPAQEDVKELPKIPVGTHTEGALQG